MAQRLKKASKKPKSDFAQNIISLRNARGWNQIDLAAAVGVHFNVIKNLENDHGKGSEATKQAVAGALGVSVSDLYGPKEKLPMPSSQTVEVQAATIVSQEKRINELELINKNLLTELNKLKSSEIYDLFFSKKLTDSQLEVILIEARGYAKGNERMPYEKTVKKKVPRK